MTLLDEVIAGATGDARIANLLRQVKILASRTGAAPLADWIGHELDGYPEGIEVPAYRGPFPVHVLGHFMGAFRSELENVQIPRSSFGKELGGGHLFEIELREAVASIESMATQGDMTMAWSADIVSMYNQLVRAGKVQPIVTGGLLLVEAKIPVSRSLIAGALDGVRNRILDLALQLEKVVPAAGESSAPAAEQGLAARVINNYFYASSNVAIDSSNVKQAVKPPARGDVEGLINFLQEAGLKPDRLAELTEAAKTDEAEEPGRWRRVRAWFVRVATDAGTEAIGGAIATAAVGFLGG